MSELRELELRGHERVWGGNGIPELDLGPLPGKRTGEWWVEADDFPLLVKVIDAHDALSIQVHPDDALARTLGHERGKTEAWFVLSTQPGAFLLLGLAQGAGAKEFFAAADRGEDVSSRLTRIEPVAGTTVFVPPGTLHSIGPGVTILEVQEQSDVTLRVFDWNREPRRELHLLHARQAWRDDPRAGRVAARPVKPAARLVAGHECLLDCDRFRVERITTAEPFMMRSRSPEMWFCAQGRACFHSNVPDLVLRRGRFCAIPAGNEVRVAPQSSAVLYRILPP